MDKPIRAAGYVRVSGKGQVENESLSTQRQSIRDFAKAQGWTLTNIYADEGISGGSIKERHALLQCLEDGQNGKFNVLVIHRLSRFGRNARELLDNHNELETAGIRLHSISEGIDFSTKYGKAILGILAVIAELEREIIRETMLENRIARARKGIPTAGSLPFARSFDKETGTWKLDKSLARLVQKAADEYLKKGRSLRDISAEHDELPTYKNLIHLLRDNSGDTWTVNFEDQEPITYQIPRILDDNTIKRIRERLAHNKIDNRRDVPKYPLTGFVRCEACGKSLYGQTQHKPWGTYTYYNHVGGKHEKCKAFASIPMKQIESAVFRTIFENVVDVPAFEQAIADSLPSEKVIASVQDTIKDGEKELKRVNRELERLVDLALGGALKRETIKSKEESLLATRAKVTEELEDARSRLKSMPDPQKVKQEAERIRRRLLEKFGSEKRLQSTIALR